MNCAVEKHFKEIRGKKIFFIGAGVSHKQLIRQYAEAGALVTLCDMKERDKLGAFADECDSMGVSLQLGNGYLDNLKDADLVFRSPGVDWTKPEIQEAVKADVKVTSEMESFFDYCPCRIIGITGSDGKTTTTTLISKVLEAAGYRVHMGGNIGIPLFPVIRDVEKDDIAVVELSSFQLISMRKSPDIAVITNVTPNHLDHHKDMQEYIDAKKNIMLYQDLSSVTVLNAENDVTRDLSAVVKGELRWFSSKRSVGNGAYMDRDKKLWSVEKGKKHLVMDLNEIQLRGEHNKENVTTAYAAVKDLVDDSVFADTVRTFPGVEHRIEYVRTVDGIPYYNDSIASSPTRTIAGLRSFEEPIVLIAGGYDKKISYMPLAEEILKQNVKAVILCGDTADAIENGLKEIDPVKAENLVIRCTDVPACVKAARRIAEAGDVVLFSPASASFDAYPNFEHRGRHFKQLVGELE